MWEEACNYVKGTVKRLLWKPKEVVLAQTQMAVDGSSWGQKQQGSVGFKEGKMYMLFVSLELQVTFLVCLLRLLSGISQVGL